MKLTLQDRIAILSIIPERDDADTIEMTSELALKASLSDEEAAEHIEDDYIKKESRDLLFEIDITDAEFNFISEKMKALQEAKLLTKYNVSLYRKFS